MGQTQNNNPANVDPSADRLFNFLPHQRLPYACRAFSPTKGALPKMFRGADGSCGKVAGKSRRRRRSGLLSSTKPTTADLPRDCPRAAAPVTWRRIVRSMR